MQQAGSGTIRKHNGTVAGHLPAAPGEAHDSPAAVRVVFVCTSGHPGGAERSLELLVRELSSRGVGSALVCPEEAVPVDRLSDLPVRRFCVRPFEPVRHPGCLQVLHLIGRGLLAGVTAMAAALRTGARIIHANDTKAMLAVLPWAWAGRRILIWHVRDAVPLGAWGRIGGRVAHRVIAVSQAVKHQLVQQGIPDEKIGVVHNGVECDEQAASPESFRRAARATLGIPADAFVYLNVGQYVAWKRQDVFLRAAAIVRRHDPDAWFVVAGSMRAGERACRSCLERLAVTSGIHDRTLLLDWQPDIGRLYAASDVLVHTADCEPFGRVIVEAMQAGVAVVAVDSGGPTEIIEDGATGLLARPGDPAACASAMLRLRYEPATRMALAMAAQGRVKRAFTASRVADNVLAIYRQVLQPRSSC
jgi:glycosyltransferase involved in cell wall biosynthesis